MKKTLSYSAYKEYHDCAYKYKLNRIDKEPGEKETSALVVGTIVDDAVMALLDGADYDLIELISEHNNKDLYFYKDDLDVDLLDLPELAKFARANGWAGDDIADALKSFMKEQDNLSEAQRKVLNGAVWRCLYTKIRAMIESFETWILPQIKEVHDVQLGIDDDENHGILDFTATLKDGRKVLFDLKTSKSAYAADAVLKSPQLSLYAAMQDYEYAGFIVLCKNLNKNKVKTCPACGHQETGGSRKNCPICKSRVVMDVTMDPTSYSQMLVNKVPDWNKKLTKEAMRETLKAIKAGIFPRNLNTCFWMYGRDCPYVSKCWKKD